MIRARIAPPAVLITAWLLVPGAAAAADRCTGNLDADHIARCLMRTRSMTIGAPPPAASANLVVQFDFGSAKLTEAGRHTLDQLAEALRAEALRDVRFEVAGHTDSIGSEEFNLVLSRHRAEAARDFLSARGIDPARLETKGYGTQRPYDPDHPDAAENRRVQVTRLSP